jgi:EmrB/QacA subfamily drug resistance transporter
LRAAEFGGSHKQEEGGQASEDRRKWAVLGAVGMGIFLSTIDGSIVNVALPTLVRSLNTNFAVVQWVVLAYLLTLATLILSMGRLGDMIGKKPVYLTGFVIFTLGSVLCGLSPSITWLIGFRVFQAIGASMLMALGVAIVTEAFPASERGRALGVTGSLVSIGIVVGPTLGGLLIDSFSWRWIFYVNLPVGIIGTLMVARFVPSIASVEEERFDFPGAATLFMSLISFLVGLTAGQQIGFTKLPILGLLGFSVVLLGVFIRIEQKAPHPMIDLALFRNRLFRINLITGSITFVSIAGTILLVPFFLEGVLGYRPSEVGLLMAAIPLAMGVIAPISGSLSDRLGARPITVVGLATLVIGYVAVGSLDSGTTVPGYLLRFLPIGLGMGIFQSPNNSAIMGEAPDHRLGVASGLLSITRILGQITGIAVMGALWATRTLAHAGGNLAGEATSATVEAQIGGLQDTAHVITLLIGLALGLGVWAWYQERARR